MDGDINSQLRQFCGMFQNAKGEVEIQKCIEYTKSFYNIELKNSSQVKESESASVDSNMGVNSTPAEIDAIILNFYHQRDYDNTYVSIQRAIRLWPEMYAFWCKLVDFHFVVDISGTPEYPALLESGLLLFPSCPGLLWMQGLHYLRQNNLQCAQHTISKSIANYNSLATSFMRRPEQLELMKSDIESITSLLLNRNERYNRTWSNTNCFPYSRPSSYLSQLPLHNFNETMCREIGAPLYCIQVGCSTWSHCAKQGWQIVDTVSNATTHYVTAAHDLFMFANDSIAAIYSSHTLEHLSHSMPASTLTEITGEKPVDQIRSFGRDSTTSELCATLLEWNRVLAPGGLLMISVPDLEIIVTLLSDPTTTDLVKESLMRYLFGGQANIYDFHKTGFFYSYLRELLVNSNYCGIERAHSFNLFNDSSAAALYGKSFSLNVRARKCEVLAAVPSRRCQGFLT